MTRPSPEEFVVERTDIEAVYEKQFWDEYLLVRWRITHPYSGEWHRVNRNNCRQTIVGFKRLLPGEFVRESERLRAIKRRSVKQTDEE